MSRTTKQKLTGGKAVDGSCANKTCATCSMAHKHKCKKREPIDDEAKTLPANIAMVDAFMGILGFYRVTE